MQKRAGVASWSFHNGSQGDQTDGKPHRPFDMREKRLFEQLDSEELKAIGIIHDKMK